MEWANEDVRVVHTGSMLAVGGCWLLLLQAVASCIGIELVWLNGRASIWASICRLPLYSFGRCLGFPAYLS